MQRPVCNILKEVVLVTISASTPSCRSVHQGVSRFHSQLYTVSGLVSRLYIHMEKRPSRRKFRNKSLLHTTANNSCKNNPDQWVKKVTVSQPSVIDADKVLTFDVSVLDTFPEDTEQKRCTVVAVHGMPGTCKDFHSLALNLQERGIRMVAPSSLGQADTPIDMKLMPEIDFSTKGRTRNLQLVLIAMNIHRVDMLLCHSAGAWTLYEAGAHWTNISSLFGINPAGAEPNSPLRPFWVIRLAAYLMQWPLFRYIFFPFMSFIYRRKGFKEVKIRASAEHLMITAQYLAKQCFEEVPQNASLIHLKQIPMLFAYSLNDKILEPSICATMAYNLLGIPIENTVFIGEGTSSRSSFFVPEGWLTRCLVFARGGHLLHVVHEKVIVDQIVDLLKLVRSKRAAETLHEKVPKACVI